MLENSLRASLNYSYWLSDSERQTRGTCYPNHAKWPKGEFSDPAFAAGWASDTLVGLWAQARTSPSTMNGWEAQGNRVPVAQTHFLLDHWRPTVSGSRGKGRLGCSHSVMGNSTNLYSAKGKPAQAFPEEMRVAERALHTGPLWHCFLW